MIQFTHRRSLSLACLALLVAPLPWLLPGLLLAHLLRRGRGDGFDGLTRLPLALAAPAIALPWLRILNVPWQETWLGLSALALVALTVGIVRSTERRWAPAAATWLLLAVAVYLVPYLRFAAPSGVDMGMHLAFARLLLDGGAIPMTQDPFFPGVSFGLYPLGFHAQTALIAQLWGDLGRSGLANVALTHAFFPVAVYLCLRRGPGLDRRALAAAVLVVWLSRSPQNYVAWGGNPSVLACAFALVALRRFGDALAAPDRRVWIEAALMAVAAATTHPTAAVVILYAAPAMLAVQVIGGGRLTRRHLTAGWPALAIGAALLAPLAPLFAELHFGADELAWIRENLKTPPQAPAPGLVGAFRHVVGQFGDTWLVVVLFIALLQVRRDRGRGLLVAVSGVAAVELMAVLSTSSWLPLTTSLVPDRVMPFALPLAALPLRGWLDGLADVRTRWTRGGRMRPAAGLQIVLLLALVVIAGAKHHHYYHRGLLGGQIVTAADREALAWLAEHAPPQGLIATEYYDAGQFVPALAGLPHTTPQVNPIWMDEIRQALAGREPVLGFTGARTWAGRERGPDHPRRGPTVFERRDEHGTAVIWRLAPPDDAGPVPPSP